MLEIDLASRLNSIENNYPLQAPLGTKSPYLTYTKVSSNRKYTHNGFSGLTENRIQIDCVDTSYLQAKRLAIDVINSLEEWVLDSDKIQAVFKENEVDFFDVETGLFNITLDFIIIYREVD